MTSYVTDWSNHNGGTLTPAQADGLVSFWHKATDGDHWYEDPYLKPHCDMARSLGVDSLGGYAVVWGNRDLTSQARWFVDVLRAKVPDALIFMSDNEPFGYNVAPNIGQVNAFNQAVCDYARVPASSVLAYCPQWHYGGEIANLRFPWVQSNYGSNPTGAYATVYQQTVGDGSSRWIGPAPMPFLQYGSRTDVGDANAFRGSRADFFTFIGQQQPQGETMQILVKGFAPDPNQVWLCDGQFRRKVPAAWLEPLGADGSPTGPISNGQVHQAGLLGPLANGGKVFSSGGDADVWGVDVATLAGSVPPANARYTVSLDGSLSGTMSGTATPMPAVD